MCIDYYKVSAWTLEHVVEVQHTSQEPFKGAYLAPAQTFLIPQDIPDTSRHSFVAY